MAEQTDKPKVQRHPTIVFLNQKKDAILGAVPQTFRAALTWERIMQSVGMALAKNPKLGDCEPHTVYTSLLEILGKGLDVGMDGQAYLVPYKGQCTAMIGAQGKIELAYRSGMIDKIVCQVVYEGDTIEMDLADGSIRHPMSKEYLVAIAEDADARGAMIAAYARVWVKGVHEPMLELMTLGDFKKIKAAAMERTGKLGPAYKLWESEMFRRSVLNRALKRAPKSRDLMEVLNRETELEEVDPLNVIDADTARPQAAQASAHALPDHGEPEDVEAELAKVAAKEKVRANDQDHPFAGDEEMPS